MKYLDYFNKKNKTFRRLIILIWLLFFGAFVLLPLYFYSVSINLGGLYGGMPSLKALENPENDLSSILLSADGVSLGKYHRVNRSNVAYEELSPALINTLISSEDHRFKEHAGIDFYGLLRAIYGTVTFNSAGGGSTITMQLSENLFNDMTESDGKLLGVKGIGKVIIKTKEWIIATQLERNFTKNEIFAMYLNTVAFGGNAFGIKAAAQTFYGKLPSELNYNESSVLIGLLQAITRFSPILNPENSLSKRNEVLRKIYRHGHITGEELDSLREAPIDMSNYKVSNQNKGLATYFRTVIRTDLMKWCKENGYDLWEDGLRVHTTINSRMQEYAEASINDHMKNLQELFTDHWDGRNPWLDDKGREIKGFLKKRMKQTEHYRQLAKKYGDGADSINIVLNLPKKMTVFSWDGDIDTTMSPMDSLKYYKSFLHTGFMSMDPHTGSIKAWVGGIDHKYFKYDHVRQGTRQPGSTFKPFVYGTAIENGYSPCYPLPDVFKVYPLVGSEKATWEPKNSDDNYTGKNMTIRQAMAQSKNSITANIMMKLNPSNVVDFANRMGITSKLAAVPSLCLGTSDVSVFELVGAYSTFANEGVHTKPYFITRIEDKNGNVIQNFVPETKQAISEETAYLMLHMLKGGIEESGGTSRGLSMAVKENNEIGGKTGTTNNASDGWYMGVTKDLVSGVWVGGDERSIHFRNWSMGQGGRTARPIWDKYMQQIYADSLLGYEKGKFKRPAMGISVELDCSKYASSSSDNEVDSLITTKPIVDVREDEIL